MHFLTRNVMPRDHTSLALLRFSIKSGAAGAAILSMQETSSFAIQRKVPLARDLEDSRPSSLDRPKSAIRGVPSLATRMLPFKFDVSYIAASS